MSTQWIRRDNGLVAPMNRFTWFRVTFEAGAAPVPTRARLAADSTAYAWLNGVSVLRGGATW